MPSEGRHFEENEVSVEHSYGRSGSGQDLFTRRIQDYVDEENAILDALGVDLAHSNPGAPAELNPASDDPDIRLLRSSFSVLTARLRQHFDLQLPELLHPLLGQIWPHILRPLPSACILQYTAEPGRFWSMCKIKRHTELRAAKSIETTPIYFRTGYDLSFFPLSLESAGPPRSVSAPPELREHGGIISLPLTLRTLPRASLNSLGRVDNETVPLSIFLSGDERERYLLYYWLAARLLAIELRVPGTSPNSPKWRHLLPKENLRPLGFGPRESLLDDADLPPSGAQKSGTSIYDASALRSLGYRHLFEYFYFPDKYMFFELSGLDALARAPNSEVFEICFLLEPLDGQPQKIGPRTLRLNCVPAVNLFRRGGRLVNVDGSRGKYPLIPDGPCRHHLDIFQLRKVVGQSHSGHPIDYHPFHGYPPPTATAQQQRVLYQTVLAPGRVPANALLTQLGGKDAEYGQVDWYLSFTRPDGQPPLWPGSDLSADLIVTNRDLPRLLLSNQGDLANLPVARSVGDISGEVPDRSFLRYSNLGLPTAAAPVVLEQRALWRYLSHGMLGWNHFGSRAALWRLLSIYDSRWRTARPGVPLPGAIYDHIANSGVKVRSTVGRFTLPPQPGQPSGLVNYPVMLLGSEVEIELEGESLGPGQLFLFGSILSHFMAEMGAVNAFSQLKVRWGQTSHTWPARLGKQVLT